MKTDFPTASVGSSQAPTAAVERSQSASNTKIRTVPQWLANELRRPVKPADVVAAAMAPNASPRLAAEVYVASALMVDDTTRMERAYLDE